MSNPDPIHRHGKRHARCGTTLKYVKNSSCVYCNSFRERTEHKALGIPDDVLDKMDAKLLDFPRRPIRIEKPNKSPVIVEIPAPPITAINRRWA